MIPTLLICWSAINLGGSAGRCDFDCKARVYAMTPDETAKALLIDTTEDGDTSVAYANDLCSYRLPDGFWLYQGQTAESLDVRGIRQDDLAHPDFDQF